jgi:hypothetical protein
MKAIGGGEMAKVKFQSVELKNEGKIIKSD